MSEKSRNSVPLRETIYLVLFLGVVMVASYFFSRPPELSAHALEGKAAPPLVFHFSDGSPSGVDKLGGKVILLNFWALWCEPCLEEMPTLAALERHFADQGLVVLAFDLGDGAGRVEKRLQNKGYPKNLVSHYSREQLAPYQVHTLPLSVLIDRRGVVREVIQGARNWMDVERLHKIETLLQDSLKKGSK